jgi:hypothetical protein
MEGRKNPVILESLVIVFPCHCGAKAGRGLTIGEVAEALVNIGNDGLAPFLKATGLKLI